MNDIMTRSLGSNQFVSKFDKTKGRRKFKVKFVTKVKIFILVSLIFSLYLNCRLLETNYTMKCVAVIGGVKQDWFFGNFPMSQRNCDEMITEKIQAINAINTASSSNYPDSPTSK